MSSHRGRGGSRRDRARPHQGAAGRAATANRRRRSAVRIVATRHVAVARVEQRVAGFHAVDDHAPAHPQMQAERAVTALGHGRASGVVDEVDEQLLAGPAGRGDRRALQGGGELRLGGASASGTTHRWRRRPRSCARPRGRRSPHAPPPPRCTPAPSTSCSLRSAGREPYVGKVGILAPVTFDHLYTYEELTNALRTLADAHPTLMTLESVGTSYEGRDIWLATITSQATGPHHEKPAVWVDANIHSVEHTGCVAALYLVHKLVTTYGNDERVTRAVDTRTFYVMPRVNPDGAELALASPPTYLRSSVRAWPRVDEAPGLVAADVDGDGRLLTMRVPDPNGPWKCSEEDARLMVPRAPDEHGAGPYYRLLNEGTIRDYDGATIPTAPERRSLDLNRQFPAGWRRARRATRRRRRSRWPNRKRARSPTRSSCDRTSAATSRTDTFSAALLRPFDDRPDDQLPTADLRRYNQLGARGTELTGYRHVSVYHDFRYDPKDVITGGADTWAYDHLGIYGWTTEFWSPIPRAPASPSTTSSSSSTRIRSPTTSRAAALQRHRARRAGGSSTGTRSSTRSSERSSSVGGSRSGSGRTRPTSCSSARWLPTPTGRSSARSPHRRCASRCARRVGSVPTRGECGSASRTTVGCPRTSRNVPSNARSRSRCWPRSSYPTALGWCAARQRSSSVSSKVGRASRRWWVTSGHSPTRRRIARLRSGSWVAEHGATVMCVGTHALAGTVREAVTLR